MYDKCTCCLSFFLQNITSFSLRMHCFIVNFIIPKVTLGKRLMATPSSCRGSSQSLDTTESSDIVGTPHGLGKTPHHSGLEVDRPLINGGVFVEIYPFKYYVHEIQIFMEKNNHITISLEYTVRTWIYHSVRNMWYTCTWTHSFSVYENLLIATLDSCYCQEEKQTCSY